MVWRRKITAWGNSLAVRLPSQLFRKTDFKEGDSVEFEVVDKHTVRISKASPEQQTPDA